MMEVLEKKKKVKLRLENSENYLGISGKFGKLFGNFRKIGGFGGGIKKMEM